MAKLNGAAMRRFLRFWLRSLAVWLIAASTCSVYLLFNIANDVRKATMWGERPMYDASQGAENRHSKPLISIKRLEPPTSPEATDGQENWQPGELSNSALRYGVLTRLTDACDRAIRELLQNSQEALEVQYSIDHFTSGVAFTVIKNFKPGGDPTAACTDAIKNNRSRLGVSISDADFEALVQSVKKIFELRRSRAD
jgi:hypothetical protein